MFINKIGVIGRTYRNLQRYREILGALFKFGFEDLVSSLKVEQYLDVGRKVFLRKESERIGKLSRPVRLRMVLEELGPTFIKLGQMLSTRHDVLPGGFIEELAKLQDTVPPFGFDLVRKRIETELEKPVTEVFAEIEAEPFAAASIGQVHRARLKSGEEVVIKVQRPGIKRTIEVDLEILMHLATLMERHLEGMDVNKPTLVVEEFGRSLERETDYCIEASNIERLASLYHGDRTVYVPRVLRGYTTPLVLTMEYVRGVQAGDLDRLRREGYDLKGIADRGAELILEQSLVHGFFHADPHPGNLLILPGNVICFLDMGMMGSIDRRTREDLVDLVLGVVKHDATDMVKALLKITEWENEPDTRELEREGAAVIEKFFNRPLKDIELSKLLEELFSIAVKFRLRVPPDLLLLIKAVSATEGLGRRFNPDFDILKKAAPFVRRVHMNRYNPLRLADDLLDYGREMVDLFRDVPGETRALLRMARKGKLKVELKHEDLENLRLAGERTGNRLSFAIVLGALIIGSSIVIHTGLPPTWHGIPLLGLIGFLVAGLMGFWLLITIIKKGMM